MEILTRIQVCITNLALGFSGADEPAPLGAALEGLNLLKLLPALLLLLLSAALGINDSSSSSLSLSLTSVNPSEFLLVSKPSTP